MSGYTFKPVEQVPRRTRGVGSNNPWSDVIARLRQASPGQKFVVYEQGEAEAAHTVKNRASALRRVVNREGLPVDVMYRSIDEKVIVFAVVRQAEAETSKRFSFGS